MARRQGAPTGRTGRRPLAACGETQAAFERRSIPAEPLRFAPFCVAFRSKYTRYSSLTRLVSRAPRRSRRSPGFHHRLLGRHSPPEAGGGKNLQFRAGAGRSGYCDMFPSSRLRYCDMFTPQTPQICGAPLPLHLPQRRATATCSRPADSATATCSPRRSRYCDMFAPRRSRYCDMFTPQIGLLRHVRAQPTPLLRHVHPAPLLRHPGLLRHVAPSRPPTATCSPRRSGYCDMFAPSRPRYCDMFTPQIGLLRHGRTQPTPLLRHVHPADRATATCSRPADPATATCSPRRSRYCDMSLPRPTRPERRVWAAASRRDRRESPTRLFHIAASTQEEWGPFSV